MNFQMKKLGLCVMLAGFASVVLPAEAATKLENVKVNNALANQTELNFNSMVQLVLTKIDYSTNQNSSF